MNAPVLLGSKVVSDIIAWCIFLGGDYAFYALMQYWCVCTYESAGGCSPVYSWLSWQADRQAYEAVGIGRQQCYVRFKLQVSWSYLSVDERSGVPAMCTYVWFSVTHIIHMHMSHEKFQYVCIHTYQTTQTVHIHITLLKQCIRHKYTQVWQDAYGHDCLWYSKSK